MLVRRWTVVGAHVLHSRETAAASRHGHRRQGRDRHVVVLPGAGTTSRSFRRLLEHLDRDADTPASALELPGLGSSSGEIPPDVPALADLVAAWARSTGRCPLTVAGVSFGSQVAAEVAVRHPDLVHRLVLIGPTVDRRGRNAIEQAAKLLLDATREPLGLLATVASDSFLTRRRAVWHYLGTSLEHHLEERLTQVSAPVALVRGSRDPMVPRRWCERLAELAPRGDVVEIEGGAHGIHHSHAPTVAELLRDRGGSASAAAPPSAVVSRSIPRGSGAS